MSLSGLLRAGDRRLRVGAGLAAAAVDAGFAAVVVVTAGEDRRARSRRDQERSEEEEIDTHGRIVPCANALGAPLG
ncbi:MAG: hypothetical protein QM749_10935 [Aquabacterium sp.]